MNSKLKDIIEKNSKKQETAEVHALYRSIKKKPSKDDNDLLQKKPAVPKYTRSIFHITKPKVQLVESFYERQIKDHDIIGKGIMEGKFLEGTLYFDQSIPDKWDGFVKVDGVKEAVKVRGLKYLNRALHLDRVVVKLVNWVIWEKAQHAFTKNIDFTEESDYVPLNPFVTKKLSDLSPHDTVGDLPQSAGDSRRLKSAISKEKDKFSGGISRLDVRSDLTSEMTSDHEFSRAAISQSVTPQTHKGKAAKIKSIIDRSSLSSDFERGEPSSHS